MDPRERYGVGPWLDYPAGDARGDALNYDPITNEYVGPSVADYGTAGLGGYVPEPGDLGAPPQPSYNPLSSSSDIAAPPRTAPASLTSQASPDVRWAPEPAPAPAAPATAPATSPPAQAPATTRPATEGWGGESASTPAPMVSGFDGGHGGVLPAYDRAAGASEGASRPPATSPQASSRRDDAIIGSYFRVLGAR
jgi:hypothetical protein